MATTQKKKKLVRRMFSRYRLVVLNEETLEEKASFRLRPVRVFVVAGVTAILLIILTTLLIAFTGLREYIPGYSDVKMKRQLYSLILKTDSMQQALDVRDLYIQNLNDIITGNIEPPSPEKKDGKGTPADTIRSLKKSPADAELRKEIETGDKYSLGVSPLNRSSDMGSFLFFPPLKGIITNRFNAGGGHYGVDVAGKSNEPIKAALDGTAVLSGFTGETGYIICIQHSNNLFSVYKHNSALLKKTGDFVRAGEVIAIIGTSGEHTTGPHLHFEMWYNGSALDPQKYISF